MSVVDAGLLRPGEHQCWPPSADLTGRGGVWRCSECRRRWVVTIDYRENRVTGLVWRRRWLPWPR